MGKTNVLFCILYLAHGGTEKQLITLINGLDRSKFIPHLCCIRKSNIEPAFKQDALELFKNIKCNKIQLDFSSFKKISSIASILKLTGYLRRNKIDIVVSYFIDPTIISFFSSIISFQKPKLIVSFRDLGLLRYSQYDLLMKWVYRRTHFFLANSEAVKKDYIENDNIPDGKLTVIYNGIDIERFIKIRRTQKGPNVIGIIANLNRRVKRVDIFLRAAACICKKRKDVSFVIIGNGELKTELKTLASNLGIRDNVDFAGTAYDIEKYLNGIHIGVNSSETEGFSNVVLEYLASGIPVVAANSGGNKEIVVDNENGYLFKVNDYRDLAGKILLLLNNNNLFIEISKNCRDSVKEIYNTASMLSNYEMFFQGILNRDT